MKENEEKSQFPWYEDEVKEKELELEGVEPGKTLLYGSSSMRMWDYFDEHFPQTDFINMAFGGSTLEACVYFFERLVLPTKPKAILFYAGDNDIGDGHPAFKVEHSLDALLNKLDEHGMGELPFAFISIKPSLARWGLREVIKKVNAHADQRMAERAHWHYIDIWDDMLDEKGFPGDHYYEEDGLHMSEAGYNVWANALRAEGALKF